MEGCEIDLKYNFSIYVSFIKNKNKQKNWFFYLMLMWHA